jgi:hypothetical protein
MLNTGGAMRRGLTKRESRAEDAAPGLGITAVPAALGWCRGPGSLIAGFVEGSGGDRTSNHD